MDAVEKISLAEKHSKESVLNNDSVLGEQKVISMRLLKKIISKK